MALTMSDAQEHEDRAFGSCLGPEYAVEHRLFRAHAELDATRAKLAETQKAVGGAYSERNRLVAMLARMFDSWQGADPDEPGWPVVFIRLPSGQVSWHIQQDEFDALGLGVLPQGEAWDGHDNDEKWRRVANVQPTGPFALAAAQTDLASEREHSDRLAESGYAVAVMARDLAEYMIRWDKRDLAKMFPQHTGAGAAFMHEYSAHAARRKEKNDAAASQ